MPDENIKILVVDDDQYLLTLLIDTLKAIGYNSVGASNGIDALDKMKQDTFNLVITDIKMPGMDGVELLGKIRNHYPHTPVLFITGVASPDIIGQIAPNGFLAKPFRISQIETLIENTLASQKGNRRKKIENVMIVDDDDSFREMMVDSLKSHNLNPVPAIDGLDALNKLKSTQVDAVITDIKMPLMDGITLLRRIKELNPSLPTIIITAYLYDDEVKANLINFSADGFLEKPFEVNKIINILKSFS